MAMDISSMLGMGNTAGGSDLFSSLQTNQTDSGSSLYTDWAGLKNGSYAKLVKNYYAKTAVDSKKAEDLSKKTLIKENNELKATEEGLRSAVSAITGDSELFTKKVTSKDTDGNTKSDYNFDKIYKNLKSFVDEYNSAVDKGALSDNKSVLRNTLQMTKITKANENLLADVGITIGEDNKLSIDESKVKNAGIGDLKSLFSGTGSYADQIDSRAAEVINNINYENNKLATYTASGTYSSTGAVGNIYDGMY